MPEYKIKVEDLIQRIAGSEEYLRLGNYYTVSWISSDGESVRVREVSTKTFSTKYFKVCNNITNKPKWF